MNIDPLLAVGATLRLSRLVTTDALGEWLIVEPIERACRCSRDDTEPFTHVERAVTGLGCPFCVGYWIGVGVLASSILTSYAGPRTHRAWRFVTAGLALNYIVGHISSRID